jgi:hypothetical protein
VCGYVWIKAAGRIPTHCANAKCRSRKWNASGLDFSKGERGKYAGKLPQVAEVTFTSEGPVKGDMRGTRSIMELEGLGMGGNPEGVLSGGVGNTSVANPTPHTESSLEEMPAWMEEPVKDERLAEGKTAYPVEEGEALFFLPCPKRDRNVQAGEWVGCSLASGHAGRCRFDGRRVSFYEDEEGA